MHKVLAAHVSQFAKRNGYVGESVEDVFEYFVNFSVVSRFYPAKIDLDLITTDEGEMGIDGVAVLLDGEIVASADEARSILSAKKKSADAQILFIQTKTSEGFDLGDILKFGAAAKDFFSEDAGFSKDETIRNAQEIQAALVENIGKIHGGRPSCSLFFATAGNWRGEKDLEAGIQQIKTELKESGYVDVVEFEPLGRDELIRLWTALQQPVETQFDVAQYMPIPPIAGAKEAYIAIAHAKTFVNLVLSDQEGRLRTHVFEQNIRSFLGDDNPVNVKIRETLTDPSVQDRFAILNNGVTIIAPDVRVQSDKIFIRDFQIVNGCQTSHLLYRNRNSLTDKICLPVKVIEIEDSDVVAQVVEATNSQSQVDQTQFLSIRGSVRKIEQYFLSFSDEGESERKLYFERRDRQYAGEGIPEVRVFDIRTLARCFAAMFLDRPDLATRYPSQIFAELSGQLYQDSQREVAYYTAALAAYRMQLLFNNKHIPASVRDRKWYLLMVLKYQIAGGQQPQLSSGRIEKYCDKILQVVAQGGKGAVPVFADAVKFVQNLGPVSEDRLKRRAYLNEIKKKLAIGT